MGNFKTEENLREEIILIARKMNSCGINQGLSGNISIRLNNGILITPSSISYDDMNISDIFYIDFTGNIIKNNKHSLKQKEGLSPSTEWRLHADILRNKTDISAILHCHSIYATAISCHQKNIPSFHYMTAIAGGINIPCAEYATFGTEELSKNCLRALKDRFACLLANHGQVSTGKTLGQAFNLAKEVETLAQLYLEACKLGKPKNIRKKEMKKVLKKFNDMRYGIYE